MQLRKDSHGHRLNTKLILKMHTESQKLKGNLYFPLTI